MSVVNDIALAEEENAATVAAAREEGGLWRTNLERQMEAASSDLERWMEAAAKAANISERGMKEAAK